MFEITIRQTFAASHALRNYPGDCGRLHGHNWEVHVTLQAKTLNNLGMVMDFREAKQCLNQIISELDHTHLNDHPQFCEGKDNPSTEYVARFIYQSLKSCLVSQDHQLIKVIVFESQNNSASYWE